jgi:hypothetical protein
MGKARDGIRVLDLTQYEAGPSATENARGLGAEVIGIELPGEEPAQRAFSARPDANSVFFCLLRGKRRLRSLRPAWAHGSPILSADAVLSYGIDAGILGP